MAVGVKVKTKTTERDLGEKRIREQLDMARGMLVACGVNEDAGTYENGTPIALVASTMEFGTKRAGSGRDITIPARPFMRWSYDQNVEAWRRMNRKLWKRIIEGTETVDGALHKMGLTITEKIRLAIARGPWKPNAVSTALRKLARGQRKRLKGQIEKGDAGKAAKTLTGSRPLMDSETLYRSIDWEVRNKK